MSTLFWALLNCSEDLFCLIAARYKADTLSQECRMALEAILALAED